MRHKKSIMAVFSMGLLLSIATTHATAEGIPFHLTFSGSGVTSPIDTNGDGIKATVTNLAG